MRIVLRVLAGLAGLLGLFIAVRVWIDPVTFPGMLGLQSVGGLGEATIRADVAGFFGMFGVLALAGAIRAEPRLLTAPALLVGLALAGRLLTIVLRGYEPAMLESIVVEVVLLAVLLAGRLLMKPRAVS